MQRGNYDILLGVIQLLLLWRVHFVKSFFLYIVIVLNQKRIHNFQNSSDGASSFFLFFFGSCILLIC